MRDGNKPPEGASWVLNAARTLAHKYLGRKSYLYGKYYPVAACGRKIPAALEPAGAETPRCEKCQ